MEWVYWYSFIVSILVVLFLSLVVVSILVQNLKRAIAGYNAIAVLANKEHDEAVDGTTILDKPIWALSNRMAASTMSLACHKKMTTTPWPEQHQQQWQARITTTITTTSDELSQTYLAND